MSGLAIIAGRGPLPSILQAADPGAVCCHLEGYAPDGVPSQPFRVERLGTLVAELRAADVNRVCFAGGIARPKLDPTQIDAATMPLVPKMMQAIQAGDDGALRAAIEVFEDAGLRVVAPSEIVPDLLDLPEVGTPGKRDLSDIDRAAAVHAVLSPLDVGQGCVVAAGQVLAVEALPGTDWMLASLTQFDGPEGGVFFKASKVGQDLRVDMATLGADTVDGAAAAGLNGIAVVRGRVMVIDRAAVAARLAETGLFLTARDP